MNKTLSVVVIIIFLLGVGIFVFTRGEKFEIPQGESVLFQEILDDTENGETQTFTVSEVNKTSKNMNRSTREIFVTDGVKHSIPLGEILSGGPPKDGIPSIDAPKFISTTEGDKFLNDNSPGLGIFIEGTARFYPYQILVWHEIVNDTIENTPLLVTYCPLCLTGIVFERRVQGEVVEFGVSGRLWRSNLLMYDRAKQEDDESLWSQVLGEAVLGISTGTKLSIIPSDTVTYGSWKKKHSDTEVLSRDTGATRSYGRDPYGSYYTNDTVSFGASFNDTRLHQKEFVFGIELRGVFKAYHTKALKEGTTVDIFEGETITIEKDEFGAVRMFIGKDSADGETGKRPLPYIGGFWFSWLAVHPDTLLFK